MVKDGKSVKPDVLDYSTIHPQTSYSGHKWDQITSFMEQKLLKCIMKRINWR